MSAGYAMQREMVRQGPFTVILVGPDEARRQAMVRALTVHQVLVTREFHAYPTLEQLLDLTGLGCDALIVDVEHEPELALQLVESVCRGSESITVMAYSGRQDQQLLMRCMRAGAREWLAEPVSASALAEAFSHIATRKREPAQKTAAGKLLVFQSAKGGSGATTLAVNFSVMLRRESQQPVALVDLNFQLGDVALLMGVQPRYSVLDAVRNHHRLDGEFLNSLLVAHSSGVMVLPAADQYDPSLAVDEAGLGRLLRVLREEFAYVVIDAGAALGRTSEMVLNGADTVYLVAQAELGALRNCRRMMSMLERDGKERVQLVANRFEPKSLQIPEEEIQRVLGARFRWKVPNQYASVRTSHDSGIPLAAGDSPVSKAVAEMARAACGKAAVAGHKKRFLGII